MAIVARADKPRSRRRHASSVATTVFVLGLALVSAACTPTAPSSRSAKPTSPSPAVATTSAAAVAGPPRCPVGEPPLAPRPWWDTAVFYEVFVRSFADSNGDGIGDLAGLTAHLDYLNDGNAATTADLGINALWLMPVARSPSYHGYDVTDYTKVEPDYGDAASFKALIAAAHQRGIKVVVDFEANHTSSEHPWFEDAVAGGKHRDWYIWSKDDPGWPNPIGAGDPWRPSPSGRDYYYALFWEGMPDLNLRNPAVTAELQRVSRFWLDTMGVDGFRIDAARHLIEDGPNAQVNTPETRAWLEGFRASVHADRPDALVVGEVNDAELTSGSYTKDGSLDMSFDFEIGPAIANAVGHGDAGSLVATESGLMSAFPAGGAGTFLSNHDQPRILTQLRGDVPAAAQAAATLLTAPGTPFVYYGEELGLTGDKPDERIRAPFPWTSAGPGYGFTTGTPWEGFGEGAAQGNVATESTDTGSLLSTYRDLIHLRDAHPALATSGIVPVESSSGHVAATLRVGGGERLLVLQNVGSDAAIATTLRVPNGSLCGPLAASVVYPDSMTSTHVPAPEVTAAGGLDAYAPVPTIPPRSTIVIGLRPVATP